MKLSLLSFLILSVTACAAPDVPPAAPAREAAVQAPAVQGPAPDAAAIARGRELLAQGKPEQALAAFEEADQKSGGALATRVWVLRTWLALGKLNDTLDEIDKLAKQHQGPEIDYLYGMGFWTVGRDRIRENAGGQIVAMNFGDAVQWLEKALARDAARFWDAHLALAESAWYAGELSKARTAAEAAVKAEPKNSFAPWMLGEVAFSQYIAAKQNEDLFPTLEGHWSAARAAFEQCDRVLAASALPADKAFRAKVWSKLGDLETWKGQKEEATRSYARAAAFDPGAVNFARLLSSLGGEGFLAMCEEAAKGYVANWGAEGKGDAGLLWWLGWARYEQKQHAGAEEAFAAAVAKWPEFLNSWFYIAMSRFARANYDGAVAAITRHFNENKDDLAATVLQSKERHLAALDFLVAHCAKTQRNQEAGLLSETQALADPLVSRYWNNAGLFYRDAGEPMRRSEEPEELAQAKELFETAYRMYMRALDLEPENPAYLNDTAVMLHYYLDREGERAKQMYKLANERAKVELARKDLTPDVRELYQIALRDSANNLAKLEKGIKTN